MAHSFVGAPKFMSLFVLSAHAHSMNDEHHHKRRDHVCRDRKLIFALRNECAKQKITDIPDNHEADDISEVTKSISSLLFLSEQQAFDSA